MASKKDLSRVYAITGAESLLVREAVADLKIRAGADGADAFDYAELDGTWATASEIIDAVATVPFLAERRTLLVGRADRFKPDEARHLGERLDRLPATSLLILVFDSQEDERKGSPAETALLPMVSKVGEVIKCATPMSAALVSDLQKRADAMGAKLDRAAAVALAEMTSNSLSEAAAELEKCSLYASGGTIDRTIVAKVATPSKDWEVFKMLDAVCAGNLGPALEHLRRLLSETSKIEDAAMRSLFPMMHRQLRILWQAKASETANGVGVFVKRHNFATASEYVQGRSRATVRNLSLDSIAKMMRQLAEADMRLKGQLPAAFPRETLERMLFEMCEIAASRN
ncbi:MAG: DNA polymerase III subunit delta [Fimbriimonadales bacterium]